MLQFSGHRREVPTHTGRLQFSLFISNIHSPHRSLLLGWISNPDPITVYEQWLLFRVVCLTPWVYPLYAVIFAKVGRIDESSLVRKAGAGSGGSHCR
jgi:hypothetical protein